MKKILKLKKTDTIKSAFELLKGRFGMIICVLSDDDSLSGVITEGDLRRAILQGFSLDTKLENVQNVKPKNDPVQLSSSIGRKGRISYYILYKF